MIYAVSRRSHFVDLIHDLTHLYLLNVTQEDLKRIILKYESLIKSKRVSSYILSVGDLLAVLEARNEISEGSVEVLKEIGVILQRPAVCERVEAYKTLITRPIPQAPSVSVASRVPLPSPAPAATNALSGPLDKGKVAIR